MELVAAKWSGISSPMVAAQSMSASQTCMWNARRQRRLWRPFGCAAPLPIRQSSSAAAECSHDIFPRIKRDMGKTAKALGALQPSSAQFSVCPNHAAKPYRVFNPSMDGKIVVNLKRTCPSITVSWDIVRKALKSHRFKLGMRAVWLKNSTVRSIAFRSKSFMCMRVSTLRTIIVSCAYQNPQKCAHARNTLETPCRTGSGYASSTPSCLFS